MRDIKTNGKQQRQLGAPDLVVNYPDGDGQLFIEVAYAKGLSGGESYQYTFTHAAEGEAWATLVRAAEGITAQDNRLKCLRAQIFRQRETDVVLTSIVPIEVSFDHQKIIGIDTSILAALLTVCQGTIHFAPVLAELNRRYGARR